MNLPRPLGDRVLVRQDKASDMIGSLYVPDTVDKVYPSTAEVLAVGPRVSQDCPAPGMRVMFKRRPASALIQDNRIPDQNPEWDGMLMLREEDLLGEVLP